MNKSVRPVAGRRFDPNQQYRRDQHELSVARAGGEAGGGLRKRDRTVRVGSLYISPSLPPVSLCYSLTETAAGGISLASGAVDSR